MPNDPSVEPTSYLHNGHRITIETEWDGVETQAELEARHDEAVRAFKAAFPEDE